MKWLWMVSVGLSAGLAFADYEKSPEPENVPELMVTRDGRTVGTIADWETVRRPELLKTFQREMFGVPPVGRPPVLRFETVREDRNALGGLAVLKVVRIVYGSSLCGRGVGG